MRNYMKPTAEIIRFTTETVIITSETAVSNSIGEGDLVTYNDLQSSGYGQGDQIIA